MKITKTKLAAASFGAAMTSLYSAPELNAQLVDITFSPAGPIPFTNLTAESNYPAPQVNFAADGFNNLNVAVYNNLPINGDPVGFIFNGFSTVGTQNTTGGVLQAGDVFDGSGDALPPNGIGFEAPATGVRYFGFIAGAGNIGWFSVDIGDDLGMEGNTVTFIDGQVLQNTPADGTIIVGRPADEILLGDVNGSGTVDFADLSPFLSLLASGEFQAEADVNESGAVDFADLSPFLSLLASSSAGIEMTWSDSTGEPLDRFAAGNEVLDQRIQEVEQKLNDYVLLTSMKQTNDVDSKTAGVGLAALAMGAAGIRRRRKAATVA